MKTFKSIIFALFAMFALNANAQSNFIGSGLMLNFDGNADNYYDLGDNYNTLNFPVTFEAWVYQEGYSLYTPVFATDSYTSGNYYGLYVRFDPTGKLIFEIGNGAGAGGAHRRGKITSTTAPLNEWIHIAIVANSITDIKFYFNGVLQACVNTDGTATNTSIPHNSNPVNLGRYATVHRSDAFIGKLDEVRLWNIARTETEIRDKMCEKLTATESGLIGYWIVDENTTDPTLEDYSVSNVNGTEIGAVVKMNSGAPIGDISVFNYTADYTGISLSLNSPGGDKLKINKIANLPYGVHLYRVNSAPASIIGLNENPNYYFGVFSADNGIDAKYTLTYTYSYSNGVATAINETDATLYKRLDGSLNSWNFQPATLTVATKRLTKKNFSGRSEFIFNIEAPNGAKMAVAEKLALNAYPQPASYFVNFNNFVPNENVQIFDLSGRTIENVRTDCDGKLMINVADYPNGIYIAKQNYYDLQQGIKFVVQH